MIILDEKICKNPAESLKREYLETNGLGGYCSSTIIGCNTRKYHSMLTVADNPPVNRFSLLSKLEETLLINEKEYHLSTNNYINNISPKSYEYITRFKYDYHPIIQYNLPDCTIDKEILMLDQKPAVMVIYTVIFLNNVNSDKPAHFVTRPFLSFRNHNSVMTANENFNKTSMPDENVWVFTNEEYKNKKLCTYTNTSYYKEAPYWYYNFQYPVETYRGDDDIEDLYKPGYFVHLLTKFENKIYFLFSTEFLDLNTNDYMKLYNEEITRRKKIINRDLINRVPIEDHNFIQHLLFAADQFIVKKESINSLSVIAGYPWFTDWGRDTMISLPGLTYVTQRYNEAKEIISSFIQFEKDGLIPNLFPDDDNEPAYNTVDAALWLFEISNKYLRYTNDNEYILKEVYPVLIKIFNSYKTGTINNIKMGSDYLIYAGTDKTQLTWMDVMYENTAVTPRNGAAVEINALWYNAVKTLEWLAKLNNDNHNQYRELAENIMKSFNAKFWNNDKKCCYDYFNENIKCDKIRPNQIYAISLIYPVLEEKYWTDTLKTIDKNLLTPLGLRSLSNTDSDFKDSYGGNLKNRDFAYHQGTVWCFLIGHYITAYFRVNGKTKESKEYIKTIYDNFYNHLLDTGIGKVNEITDAIEPYYPRGCISQAWSVAELLRSYFEDYL